MKQNVINIYSDHIQKRIEQLENEVNRNCLKLYNKYKPLLEEAYVESIVEYDALLTEYNFTVEEINASLLSELEYIYKTCTPVKILDYGDVYFHGVVQ